MSRQQKQTFVLSLKLGSLIQSAKNCSIRAPPIPAITTISTSWGKSCRPSCFRIIISFCRFSVSQVLLPALKVHQPHHRHKPFGSPGLNGFSTQVAMIASNIGQNFTIDPIQDPWKPFRQFHQDLTKSRKRFERFGCFNLRMALASIWRILSLVTLNSRPTSSRVLVLPSLSPKRRRSTCSSLLVKDSRTRFSSSLRSWLFV